MEWLERVFEEVEVLDVVIGMVRDKGPSPDSFSIFFFFFVKLVGILREKML